MQFRDLKPGAVIETGSRVITESEIVEFASRYDPQWFHIDRELAERGRWKGLIASGWHTAAVGMELVVKHILIDSSSFGSPGLDGLKWLAPVRPGDALKVSCHVLESSVSASGGTGIIRWTWQISNQSGVTVCELTATSLFALGEQQS
jgi:acyl dehydratase